MFRFSFLFPFRHFTCNECTIICTSLDTIIWIQKSSYVCTIQIPFKLQNMTIIPESSFMCLLSKFPPQPVEVLMFWFASMRVTSVHCTSSCNGIIGYVFSVWLLSPSIILRFIHGFVCISSSFCLFLNSIQLMKIPQLIYPFSCW